MLIAVLRMNSKVLAQVAVMLVVAVLRLLLLPVQAIQFVPVQLFLVQVIRLNLHLRILHQPKQRHLIQALALLRLTAQYLAVALVEPLAQAVNAPESDRQTAV